MNAPTSQAGNAAILSVDQGTQKWTAVYQGKILAKSKNRQYIIDTITRGMNQTANACGVTHVIELTDKNVGDLLLANDFQMPIMPEFSITERFEFLENLAEMAIAGSAKAVLVTGEGGLGKSFTVMGAIKAAGLTFTSQFEPPAPKKDKKKDATKGDDSSSDDDEEDDDGEVAAWVNPGQVHLIKGFSSAKGLYRALFENNGKLIIFDDCDSIHKDANAVNILKGALDSTGERWISWNAEEGRGAMKLPRSFMFTGRVIFISNKSMASFETAFKTRCHRVDLTMFASEKIERMEFIINQPSFEPDTKMEIKIAALEFLRENMNVATALSLRSLNETISYRKQNKPNWERQALYSLIA